MPKGVGGVREGREIGVDGKGCDKGLDELCAMIEIEWKLNLVPNLGIAGL